LLAAAFPDRIEEDDYSHAWADMRTILRLLWDPSGLKLKLVEACSASGSLIAAMIWPRRDPVGEDLDTRNENRRVWRHPVSGETSMASVEDLTAAAARDTAGIEQFLTESGGTEQPTARWADFLCGINHEGHRPGERMLFQNSLFS
jgi:hypothetical protein